MSAAVWHARKTRLNELLGVEDDEDNRGVALDRILHGQSVIGRTAKTAEIEKLRFGDKDLRVIGTLEYGQYGVIDIVSCKLDNKIYVRKSVEKKFAIRTHEQCSPKFERDILLRATVSLSHWAPHLLCAFQTDTHLNLVMDYAEGGTLWDVLESSPLDGRVSEDDLRWWAPQMVSAIDWCHSQGFVHRDVKPHNFVLNAKGHVLLIDFGSAAPLLPPSPDGSQSVPKKYCLVPCGTCDYISPEILQCHEEALVALEMADSISDPISVGEYEPGGYGRETDWWSMGAMLYEMIYGIAPFFAKEIRQTYLKIVDHYRSLKFKLPVHVSPDLQDLIRRLLTTAELRLGRQSVEEIRCHSFFKGSDWGSLHTATRPENLHLPQFTYSTPLTAHTDASPVQDEPSSVAFAFSALFQSSSSSPSLSVLQPTPSHKSSKSILREQPSASFIGFSWGPSLHAFPEKLAGSPEAKFMTTPHAAKLISTPLSSKTARGQDTVQRDSFQTPVRPSSVVPFQTVPRTGTIRRTAQKRPVSDREAMKQLVNCVGMSARKKVLESGRKPRILTSTGRSRSSTLKGLRFDRSVMVFNGDSGGTSYRMDPTTTSESAGAGSFSLMSASVLSGAGSGTFDRDRDYEEALSADFESSVDSELMYSPSPSPRPSSTMSMAPTTRGATPTISGGIGAYMLRTSSGTDGGRASPSLVFGSSVREQPASTDRTSKQDETGQRRRTVDEQPPMGSASQPANAGVSSERTVDPLAALERRHARLLRDIAGITERLSEVALRVSQS